MRKEEVHGAGEVSDRPGANIATVKVPYTCGELWQGSIDGEQPALVSLPIGYFSSVTAYVGHTTNPIPKGMLAENGSKSKVAFMRTLQRFGYHPRYDDQISISSNLPKGRGLGTSTADISATIYATARALGEKITPMEVAEIAISIEPSNGTMFPGFHLFDHRGGAYYEDLSAKPYPNISVLVLGFDGVVDTVAYNEDYRADTIREMRYDHYEALTAIKQGFRYCNPEDIGYGATLSARCHQRILYKPYLETVIKMAKEVHAYGVNVAHSGTVVGVLLGPMVDIDEVWDYFEQSLEFEFVRGAKMVPGGPRYD
jgi:L-threonine kinase